MLIFAVVPAHWSYCRLVGHSSLSFFILNTNQEKPLESAAIQLSPNGAQYSRKGKIVVATGLSGESEATGALWRWLRLVPTTITPQKRPLCYPRLSNRWLSVHFFSFSQFNTFYSLFWLQTISRLPQRCFHIYPQIIKPIFSLVPSTSSKISNGKDKFQTFLNHSKMFSHASSTRFNRVWRHNLPR